MEIKELMKFIDLENNRLIEKFGKNTPTTQERIISFQRRSKKRKT